MQYFIVLLSLILCTCATKSEALPTIDYTTCGKTAGCFVMPPDCQKAGDTSNCAVAASTVVKDANTITITLQTKLYNDPSIDTSQGTFVAFGLSNSGGMGDTSVMNCLYNPNTNIVEAQLSYNTPYDPNSKLPPNMVIQNMTSDSSVNDNLLICKFDRPTLSLGESRIFNATTAYTLLVTRGKASFNTPVGDKNFGIEGHSTVGSSNSYPFVSDKKYVITQPFIAAMENGTHVPTAAPPKPTSSASLQAAVSGLITMFLMALLML